MTPASALVRAADTTITLTGTGFVPETAVTWRNAPLATTYVSATEVKAVIPAADLTKPTTQYVEVINPTPGGGLGGSLPFAVYYPTPVITSLHPSSVVVGSGDFTLSVFGRHFTSDCIILIDFSGGRAYAKTTIISPTELQTVMSNTQLTAGGYAHIFVERQGAASLSAPLPFTFFAPAPTIAGLFPNTLQAGGKTTTIKVTGQQFDNAALLWDGHELRLTQGGDTFLRGTVPASKIAQSGTVQINVRNPAPGGGATSTLTLTISTQPGPLLTNSRPIAWYLARPSPSLWQEAGSRPAPSSTGTGSP